MKNVHFKVSRVARSNLEELEEYFRLLDNHVVIGSEVATIRDDDHPIWMVIYHPLSRMQEIMRLDSSTKLR